jgi:sugar lactone lactonase YvrE
VAVTALAVSPEGLVYGGTSSERGKSCWLFRTNGESIAVVSRLTDAIPGQERIVNSLVIASDGRLFGGTTNYAGEEDVPESYEGGHLFSMDPAGGEIRDHGIPVKGQGVICMVIDPERNAAYGLTYPRGHLVAWDLDSGRIEDKGPTVPPPEAVREPRGDVWLRWIPRALALDARGNVYGTRERGYLWRYAPDTGTMEPLDAKIPVGKGRDEDWLYNHVADSFCLAADGVIYGGTSADGYLFAFYPDTERVINLGKPLRQARIRAIAQAADGGIYGLAGEEDTISHLVRYDPETRGMEDLGVIAENLWDWVVYRAGAMAVHPSGEIFIGQAERISSVVVYNPTSSSMQEEEGN